MTFYNWARKTSITPLRTDVTNVTNERVNMSLYKSKTTKIGGI